MVILDTVTHTVAVEQLALVVAGGAAAYYGTLRALYRFGAARDMRRRLVAAGVPTCLKCGYPLRGLAPTTESCPECGRKIPARTRALV